MKTVIYMDVLLALNLLLTFACLRLTAFLLGKPQSPLRFVCGSIVGAAISPVILLPSYGPVFSLAVRAAAGFAVVIVTFFPIKGKKLLTAVLLFSFVGAAFAGLMMLMQTVTQTEIFSFRNGVVYTGIGPIRLLLYTAAVYAAVRFVFFLLQKKEKTKACTVYIAAGGKTVSADGIIDTGNGACDLLTGKTVCVASLEAVSALFSPEIKAFFLDYSNNSVPEDPVWKGKLSVVSIQTVTGRSLLPAFFPEKLTLEADGKRRNARNCLLAVTKEKTETGVILHRDIQYEEEK